MGKFLSTEKINQAHIKTTSPYFSEPARSDGVYRKKPRPFCLPLPYAEQNLYAGIRDSALQYFSHHRIKWHDGHNGKPSNHLCDSQVCCINFLFPFTDHPGELKNLLQPLYPEMDQMLPVESSNYIAFEWIGNMNYLGEKVPRSGRRTRGANCTSADAAVLFKQKDGNCHLVLIEWKYTESYGRNSLQVARSGTDRTKIYRPLFQKPDSPINRDLLPGFRSLFYEPFYQLMRQQFLAHEMEKAGELGADIVSVLHIAPAHNTDFNRVTSFALANLGKTPIEVWKNLVTKKDSFNSINTEELFGRLSEAAAPTMTSWLDYIHARYPWMAGQIPFTHHGQ